MASGQQSFPSAHGGQSHTPSSSSMGTWEMPHCVSRQPPGSSSIMGKLTGALLPLELDAVLRLTGTGSVFSPRTSWAIMSG